MDLSAGAVIVIFRKLVLASYGGSGLRQPELASIKSLSILRIVELRCWRRLRMDGASSSARMGMRRRILSAGNTFRLQYSSRDNIIFRSAREGTMLTV